MSVLDTASTIGSMYSDAGQTIAMEAAQRHISNMETDESVKDQMNAAYNNSRNNTAGALAQTLTQTSNSIKEATKNQ